jgi:type IV secretion system protein VirD4
VPPPAQEFDITEDDADDAARQAQVRRTMQAGIARQVSLDPGDDMNL